MMEGYLNWIVCFFYFIFMLLSGGSDGCAIF